MNDIKAGTTSRLDCVFITNVSTGAPITGAVFGTVSIAYMLSDGTTVTKAAAVTMTLGTWVSNGFVQVDATNFPGLYQIGVPNAPLATAGKFGFVSVTGVASQAPAVLKYQIVAYDPNDAVRLGLTAMPNVAAGAAGGLPTATNASGQVTYSNTAPPSAAANATAAAAAILATPANLLATDASGHVSLAATPPTAAAIAAVILATPANLLATDGSGRVVSSSVSGNVAGTVGSVVAAVELDLTQAVPHSNTHDTVGDALHAARVAGFGDVAVNTGALTYTAFESDHTTPARVWAIDSKISPTQRVSTS